MLLLYCTLTWFWDSYPLQKSKNEKKVGHELNYWGKIITYICIMFHTIHNSGWIKDLNVKKSSCKNARGKRSYLASREVLSITAKTAQMKDQFFP